MLPVFFSLLDGVFYTLFWVGWVFYIILISESSIISINPTIRYNAKEGFS